MATLKDVAEATGVSITAASLVLNRPEGTTEVSKETAERIRKKARELHYHPNAAAQRLAKQQTNLIGLVTNQIGDFMAMRRLQTIVSALLGAGYQPLLWCMQWSQYESDSICNMLISNAVVGVILEGLDTLSKTDIAEQLVEAEIATLSLDAGEGLPGIGVDRERAFHDLACAAIQAGHREIGYLDAGFEYAARPPRRAGIHRAIAECEENVDLVSFHPTVPESFTASPDLSVGQLDFEIGSRGADLFLDRDHRPSAMICNSDHTAIAFMNRIQRQGVKVPDHVAVFGFDGISEAIHSNPPLTTMAQPLEQISEEAVARLLALIEKPDEASREYVMRSCSLVIRESTGPIMREDGADG